MAPQPWDGKTDRRRNEKGLTVTEEVLILHQQFEVISDRITAHKKAQDEGFKNLQESIDRIEKVLIPRDGSPSIPEQIRSLDNFKKQIIAIWVFVGGIIVQLTLRYFDKHN